MNYLLKTIGDVEKSFMLELSEVYGTGEVKQFVAMAIEEVLGLTREWWLIRKETEISSDNQIQLGNILERLSNNEPIQYIFERCEFLGLSFFVNKDVLIPRPETEELVSIVIDHVGGSALRVLDLGTGSGCIPISLKIKCPHINVFAADISVGALTVAKQNALEHDIDVSFVECNILEDDAINVLPEVDVIISNPPYVTNSQKSDMRNNVLAFEPDLALFVSDEDPLLFYRRIAQIAKQKLKIGGVLFFEINELFGRQILEMLSNIGFERITITKDLFGKDRFVQCCR